MTEPVDYRPMWTDLGLDLEKHDMLLAALGALYQETFLSQANRPKGMGYFDFVMSEVHGLRIKELVDARAAGRIVVGSYCVFVPEEFILAVDGVSVGLCAGADFAAELAEPYLPRTTCALVKAIFTFALSRVCPYLMAADLVVGENTCDGKKKAYERLPELEMVRRLHVIDLPSVKSVEGRLLLKAEYLRFIRVLEEISGRRVTVESLRKGIATANEKRRALHRLAALRGARPTPISGLDGLLPNQVHFYDDPVRLTGAVNALCDELEQRVADGMGVAPAEATRLVVAGCPAAVPNWKVHRLAEEAGAVVVGDESCIGERGLRNLVDDRGETLEELIDAVVERYFAIDCAVFTPNPERFDHIEELARRTDADGVVLYALQFCAPYQNEALGQEPRLETIGIPAIRIETDYGAEDREPLRTRLEAFVERLG